jgi:hypothetical protein
MSRIAVLALLLVAALSTACDSATKTAKTPTSPDAPGAPTPSPTGILEVRIKGGSAIPRTGYTVTVDDSMSLSGQTDFSVMFPGLSVGDHSVELRVMSTVCRASGDNPRKVVIVGGTTVVTEFDVECMAAAPLR